MKTKKLQDFNFLKSFKCAFIISLVIILAGILTIIFAGFNLSVQLSGGSIIKISVTNSSLIDSEVYNDEFIENKAQIINSVEDILNEKGLSAEVVQIEGEGNEQYITIIYKNKNIHKDDMDALNNKIQTSVQTYLDDLSTEIDFTLEGPSSYSGYAWISIIKEVMVVCLVLVAMFIYFALRVNPIASISSLFGMIINIGLVISIFAVTRIQVSTLLIMSIGLSLFISLMYELLVYNEIKNNYLLSETINYQHKEIVNISINSQLSKLIVFGISIFIIGCILTAISLTAALSIFVATAVSIFCSLFISLQIYANIAEKKKYIPKKTKLNK